MIVKMQEMDQNRDAIRLNSVRRIDPHVMQIVDSANRTALYSYEQGGESWAKTDVEGTLMVYSRLAPPHHMVTIINRLNKSNFIEPLSSSCDIQVKPPYLLFRNAKGVIYGIWFSDGDDVQRIANAIQEHMKGEPQPAPQPAPNILADPAVAVAGAPGGDIMSMLSRAHGEFESKRQEPRSIVNTATSTNNDLVKPAPLRVQAGEQNTVADFFAKVSVAQAGGGMAGLGGAGLHSPSGSAPPPASTTNASSPGTNPVLQKLFQGAAAVGGQAMVQLPGGAAVQGQPGTGATNPVPIPGAGHQSHASSLSSSVPTGAPISLQELEGRFKDNLKMSSQTREEEASTAVQQQQQQQKQPYAPQLPHSEPSLLSPQVFTSSRTSDPPASGTPPLESSGPRNFADLLASSSTAVVDVRPLNGSQESLHDGLLGCPSQVTPLTQEQLVQAFTLLLKKDDFVRQLHEAYVQALNQSLKGFL
ncbi:mRNA-decapping enzyme 1A-like isoform X1 [Portunus trituberculatus]|uniref:mRNA-decapping enzyme 1B n=2 Tax=Portunus trituberculatus TaxID=210409 RepID=A0A5B7GTN7_PORTR|nr:mRNA-decapping enzyme 1A-like isoform X1 [Portunus trituberculatus]MPC59924.1 mRNA-decapping enzyme 1B [Portunus trituberculatus]